MILKIVFDSIFFLFLSFSGLAQVTPSLMKTTGDVAIGTAFAVNSDGTVMSWGGGFSFTRLLGRTTTELAYFNTSASNRYGTWAIPAKVEKGGDYLGTQFLGDNPQNPVIKVVTSGNFRNSSEAATAFITQKGELYWLGSNPDFTTSSTTLLERPKLIWSASSDVLTKGKVIDIAITRDAAILITDNGKLYGVGSLPSSLFLNYNVSSNPLFGTASFTTKTSFSQILNLDPALSSSIPIQIESSSNGVNTKDSWFVRYNDKKLGYVGPAKSTGGTENIIFNPWSTNSNFVTGVKGVVDKFYIHKPSFGCHFTSCSG